MEQKIAVIGEMSFDECLDALKNLHKFTLLRQIWSGDNTPVMEGMSKIAGELAGRIDELCSWVSVEDKLPENDGWYLCSSVTVTMNTNRTQPTMFQFRNGRFSHPSGIRITHWYNINSSEDKYEDKEVKEFVEEYETVIREYKEALRAKFSTIPVERWGVHITHCCKEHGCKYGDTDCPIELGQVKQGYPCQECDWND